MKNSNLFRVLAAIAVSLMMVLTTFPMPAFAAETADVTIEGLEPGATVTLYKIVDYVDGNWQSVKFENGTKAIANVTAPTGGEITAITKGFTSDPKTIELTQSYTGAAGTDGKYTANAKPGMYLALVSKTNGEYVYNPMVVAINYDENGQAINDNNNIKLPSNFTNAYAKRSKPEVTKTTDWAQKGDTAVDKNGNTLTAGDRANFKIVTDIPAFSDAYKDPTFQIHDKVSDGLEDIDDIVVKVSGEVCPAANYEIVPVTDTAKGTTEFTIKFKNNGSDKFMWADAARSVEVTYTAKLNEKAFNSGFNPNMNECDIKFSNDPSNSNSYGTDEDDTKTYTFNIDGELFGPNGTSIKDETTEVIKVEEVEEDGTVVTKMVTKTIVNETTGIVDDTKVHPLAGAEFELRTDADDPDTVIRTAITDTNGRFVADDTHSGFLGLGVGTYYIVETKAPTGYALNDTPVEVVIDATIDQSTGLLQDYSITIGGATSKYNRVENPDTHEVTIQSVETNETYLYPNSQVGTLPSTGGIGTILFTIGGIIIMALALFLFFGGRKKQTQK